MFPWSLYPWLYNNLLFLYISQWAHHAFLSDPTASLWLSTHDKLCQCLSNCDYQPTDLVSFRVQWRRAFPPELSSAWEPVGGNLFTWTTSSAAFDGWWDVPWMDSVFLASFGNWATCRIPHTEVGSVWKQQYSAHWDTAPVSFLHS